MKKVEIMDTTLRDGEQTSGVAFSATEKLNIAKVLLEEVKVDRIEVASARISQGEFEAVQKIVDWAIKHNFLQKVEVLGFIDGTASLDWIHKAGGKVVNLLSKGSYKHLEGQLRKTPEQHLEDIKNTIAYAEKIGIQVNLYLEDWSNGMRNSPDYVFGLINGLKQENIQRFMLPDTLGILNPDDTFSYCTQIRNCFPEIHFDHHAHNDYDFAVANCYAAVKAGFNGIHTTVNGLGERSGNTPLSSAIAVLTDHLKADIAAKEDKLNKISKLVEAFSGVRIPINKPIVGEHVFTQTCGVHADGDNKGKLYYNDLMPERFGRIRKYALGKTSGNASIKKNLEELGIELAPEHMAKVTQRVVELGDRKKDITQDDLPYIISDVLGSEIIKETIRIKNYHISHVHNLKPVATLSIDIKGTEYEETSTGDGQYDAFMKALASIYKRLGKELPMLIDYSVAIPPGGKTDALVETVITWKNSHEFKTRGLDSDQTSVAIKATLKMLNLIDKE